MKKICVVIGLMAALCQAQEKYEITVQGERIPLAFDLRRNVIIIEGETLRKFPALNLAQLLSFAANMNFVSKGLFVADSQILGFNQEQIVVMIHGMPVNNIQTGHHNFILPLDPGQIERIEILRGSFSSLFGPSGSAGAVNIIPAGGRSIKTEAGSFRTYGGALNLGLGRSYLSAGVQSTDGYREGLDGSRLFIQGGTRYESSGSAIDFWGGWVRSKFGATNFYAPYPSFEDVERLLGVFKWRRELNNKNLFLTLNASSQLSNDRFRLFRDNPDVYFNHHRAVQNSLELGLNGYLKNLSFAGGVSGFIDGMDSSGTRNGEEAAALGRRRRRLYAVFGEVSGGKENVFINGGFRLTAGDYRNISGHLLLGFSPAKGLKLESSVSRSFRIPTYTELYYEDPVHLANPRLRPEITWGFDVGLKSTSRKYRYGVRFFRHLTTDMIDWTWDPARNLWLSKNVHTGQVNGMDAEGSVSLKRGTVRVLYTWQKADFSRSFQAQLLKYHFYFPEHSLSISWNAAGRFLSLSAALKAEKANSAGRIRYYLNVRAEKGFRKITVFMEAFNLFDNRVEKTPGLPESPRTFNAGMSLGF